MARREVNVFNVSFLDVIFCGFGALVLLFVIINAKAVAHRVDQAQDLRGEVSKLELEVLQGRKNMVITKNTLAETTNELAKTEGLARKIENTIEEKKVELAQAENSTLATKEHVNKLKADLKSLEEDYKRLKAAAEAEDQAVQGNKIKAFVGDGDRQYLTGIKVGGQRILILVDASASMLGEQIVDVIIRRNLPDATKRLSDKWQKTISTIDWITSQFPANSTFQIYTFNETLNPLLPSHAGKWQPTSNPTLLKETMTALRAVVPQNGTSLHQAFSVFDQLESPPDNLFLLTDSLPTIGLKKTRASKVNGAKRLKYFNEALYKIPKRLPVNVILLAMEGDPKAASAFWKLAIRSNGSFFSPSEDWP